MHNDEIYWGTFLKACKENKYELVEGFCSEKDFDQYSHNYEALEISVKSGALDVVNTFIHYDIENLDFLDREYLLVWLLNLKLEKEDDRKFRDRIAFIITKKGWRFYHTSWADHGYDKWDEYGHLYAAFKTAPETFLSLFHQCSDRDKFETMFLFLTQWTRTECEIPIDSYNTLRNFCKKYIYVVHVDLWFQDPTLNNRSFADYFADFEDEEDLLREVRGHVKTRNLLMVRVLMSSSKWFIFSYRQNTFSVVKYAHAVGAHEIRDFIINQSKSFKPLTWPQVFDSLCEMPDLSSLKRKRSEDQDREELVQSLKFVENEHKTNKKTKK